MKTKKFKVTLELPKDIADILEGVAAEKIEKVLTHSLAQLLKTMEVNRKGARKQFDKFNKYSLLTRVYYYQKTNYPKDYVLQNMLVDEFREKWVSNKKFKKIWNKYEESEFDPKLKPVFVRSVHTDELNIGTPKNRAALNYAY